MKISVVTVAFNSASTIADNISSVRFQKYSDFEHLVIDGGSKDATLDIIKKSQFPHLRVISEPDNGIYDAMNKGLELSLGDVIGFLNSDDVFADDMALVKVADVFDDPSVMVCFGDLLYVTKDLRRVVRYWKSKPFISGSFAHGWTPAHPTFYIRREALVKVGLFDLRYRLAADAEFMMRCLESVGLKSKYIPHVLVNMRVGGVSNKSLFNIFQQNHEVLHGLRKNNLEYSYMLFWIEKLINRLFQRFNARCYEVNE